MCCTGLTTAKRIGLRITLPAAVLLAAAVLAASQSRGVSTSLRTFATDPKARLASTIDFAEQKYCSDGQISVRLTTTYKNVGTVPILLYKGKKSLYRYEIRGATNIGFSSTIEPMFDLSRFIKSSEPAEDEFLRLMPGDAVVEPWSTPTPIAAYAHDDNKLAPGTYTLTITDLTWPYAMESIQPYFEKWTAKGALWWTDVTSDPMPFAVVKPKKDAVVRCTYPRAEHTD